MPPRATAWKAGVIALLLLIWLQLGGAHTVERGWRAFSRWSGLAGKEEPAQTSGGLMDAYYEENLRRAAEEAQQQASAASK